MPKGYDFCGWATRNDIRCGDGRIIRKDAFKDNDGMTVPLVWNHQHGEPYNVLGHAILENRDDGVYAYGYLNDTESGKNARGLLKNGDIHSLSIYANKLQQNGSDVIHGMIREVSLVLAGANPGATIEAVIAHAEGDDLEDDLFVINHSDEIERTEDYTDDDYDEKELEKRLEGLTPEQIEALKKKLAAEGEDQNDAESDKDEEEVEHSDEGNSDRTVKDVFDEMTDEQKNVVYALVGAAVEQAKKGELPTGEDAEDNEEDISHSDEDNEEGANNMANEERTVKDVFDEMTEEQKSVVYALVGAAVEQAKKGELPDDEDTEEDVEDEEMKQNAFENDRYNKGEVLSHAEMQDIMSDARKLGSLKEAVLQHGITDIGYMFPDAKSATNMPVTIDRDQGWVKEVMGSTSHTPFARVKSVLANITADEARARGYVKGNQKIEETFAMLKRETTPQTIYKKQKIDRDDMIDITDFDVVAWLKNEMRGKLDEEIARAILVGDGRTAASDDKIDETHIRPIWTDDDLFTIKQTVETGADDNATAKNFIKAAVRARKSYKGTGNPVLFCTEDTLTNCLLLEDSIGRAIYDSEDKLATALRVSKIVSVPVMENLTRTADDGTHTLMGIIVNLKDYNVGADKGGAVSLLDDFDIDYNAQKYLIETRCSGALVMPYSAIALETVESSSEG